MSLVGICYAVRVVKVDMMVRKNGFEDGMRSVCSDSQGEGVVRDDGAIMQVSTYPVPASRPLVDRPN